MDESVTFRPTATRLMDQVRETLKLIGVYLLKCYKN